jgi:predicted HD phosphohydrolase
MNAKITPLMAPGWSYVEQPSLDRFTAADWALLDRQREPFLAERRADQVLAMFATLQHQPSFGYAISMYRHGVQTATMLLKDGHDEETVVVGLLHDFAYDFCVETHGAAAAALMGPFASERNEFLLRTHQAFQSLHCATHPACDPNERDQWRGHPHFAWVADFVARYDQVAINADGPEMPLEAFRPMVHRFFARPPRIPAAG